MDERVGDAIADGMDLASRKLRDAPRRVFGNWVRRLPLGFRVLYKQFLLRVIDLESLSIEADIPRFLGQFAGILIMFSLLRAVGMLFFPPPPAAELSIQQSQFSLMMLIAGLITVISWDSIFPDRRDVMILAPLPVRPQIILLAKLAASAGLIGLAIVCVNCASSLAFAGAFAGLAGFPRYLLAWWFTMAACSAFLYCAVFAVQGLTALLLPRRAFLRLSAILQLVAFALFLGAYFLAPTFLSFPDFTAAANHTLVARMPSFWFVALFNQLAGHLPSQLTWLATRAWIALGIVVAGAGFSLLLSYTHTMKRIVEEPDLVPWCGRLPLGSPLQPLPSRRHRALFPALHYPQPAASPCPRLLLVRHLRAGPGVDPQRAQNPARARQPRLPHVHFSHDVLAVLGLRGVFSLPISLHANWMLRVTQLRPTTKYLAATRLCLLLFGVTPIWIIAAAFSFHFTPWQPAARHLAFLALAGWVLVELGLVRFYKVPFTCSYLPGKTNVQVIFWGFVFVLFILGFTLETYELGALTNLPRFFSLMAFAAAAAAGLFAYNRVKASSAVLYFEELPPEIITRLGLVYVPPAQPTFYKNIFQLGPSLLFPVPCSLFPVPCSLFPVPCSLFPVPRSLLLTPLPQLPASTQSPPSAPRPRACSAPGSRRCASPAGSHSAPPC